MAIVGTFPEQFGAPESGAIHVLDIDAGTGRLQPVQITTGLHNPSFLALHPAQARAYAVERRWSADDEESGALTTFEIATDGRLSCVDRVRSGGRFSSHVSVAPSGKRLFVANPRSASVSAFRLGDGGIPEAVASVAQSARTANAAPVKNGPWTHSAFTDPAERRVLACDFGSDSLSIFELDDDGAMRPSDQPIVSAPPGSGPRHLAFHREGRHFYVVNERNSTIGVYTYDGATGRAHLLETAATLPSGGTSAPGEIYVADRFVFCSNRGHDTIATFAIADGGARVRPVSWQRTGGEIPRHFAIDTVHGLALVANQRSGSVASFWLDGESGTLAPTGHRVDVPDASCVVVYESPSERG